MSDQKTDSPYMTKSKYATDNLASIRGRKKVNFKIPGGGFILFLFGLAAEFSPMQNTSISIILVIIAALIMAIGFVAPLISMRDMGGQRALVIRLPKLFKKDLQQRAFELSQEIVEFLAKRDRGAPGWQSSKEMMDYINETMRLYETNYLMRTLALYDTFSQEGINTNEDRFNFEHPTNPLGAKDVAMRLATWGSKR